MSVPPAPGPRGADSSTRSHLAYFPSSGTHEPPVLAIPPGPRGADSSTRSHLAYSPSSGTHEPLVLAIPPALGRWSYCSTPPPDTFDSEVHVQSELSQLQNAFLLHHGVTNTRGYSDRNPTCIIGHVLSRVVLLEFSRELTPSRTPTCCICSDWLAGYRTLLHGVYVFMYVRMHVMPTGLRGN